MLPARRSTVALTKASGMDGQYQVPSTISAPWLLAWRPSWSMR